MYWPYFLAYHFHTPPTPTYPPTPLRRTLRCGSPTGPPLSARRTRRAPHRSRESCGRGRVWQGGRGSGSRPCGHVRPPQTPRWCPCGRSHGQGVGAKCTLGGGVEGEGWGVSAVEQIKETEYVCMACIYCIRVYV